jgi:F-type H+-transporting ATPase subunit delta
MAEKSTIARPYAQAAFEIAQAGGQLKNWSEMLAVSALIAADPAVDRLVGNTNINREQLAQLFLDVAGERLNAQGKNFIKLLAENRRLNVLPEIAEQYEVLRAEAEKTIRAEMVSAFDVSAEQQQQIVQKLKARLGRDVTLTVATDASLMGGAIIKAGDLVIDGSVTGKLNKLSVGLAG